MSEASDIGRIVKMAGYGQDSIPRTGKVLATAISNAGRAYVTLLRKRGGEQVEAIRNYHVMDMRQVQYAD